MSSRKQKNKEDFPIFYEASITFPNQIKIAHKSTILNKTLASRILQYKLYTIAVYDLF
jgi:hypothetical protein